MSAKSFELEILLNGFQLLIIILIIAPVVIALCAVLESMQDNCKRKRSNCEGGLTKAFMAFLEIVLWVIYFPVAISALIVALFVAIILYIGKTIGSIFEIGTRNETGFLTAFLAAYLACFLAAFLAAFLVGFLGKAMYYVVTSL